MVHIGMIFQYDSTQGMGLVMITGGEKREFTLHNWIDGDNQPAVGQKVTYDESSHPVRIQVANEDDKIIVPFDEENQYVQIEDSTDQTEEQNFTDVDNAITNFTDMGFKVLKDIKDDESRTVTLRLYTPTDYGEVTIKQSGLKISVNQIINGKTIS
jgi:hypothetical protein